MALFKKVYVPAANGYYSAIQDTIMSNENVALNDINVFAYDRIKKIAYATTSYGVGEFILQRNASDLLLLDKNITLSSKENTIQSLVLRNIDSLDNKFKILNERRSIFIADSLEHRTNITLFKQKQIIADSIAFERKKILAKAARQKEIDEYKLANPSHSSFNFTSIYCPHCYEKISSNTLFGVSKDTVIFISARTVVSFAKTIPELHYAPLKLILEKNPNFQKHIAAYSDSIDCKLQDSNIAELVDEVNSQESQQLLLQIKKYAPFGFIESWSWDNEYGPITFKVTYRNSNKKTIKYIDFAFSVYNAVDDLRGSGTFKGTGPVEYLDEGSWTWDNSRYWFSKDVSYLTITKITITYMDGTKQVIPKKKIVYNELE